MPIDLHTGGAFHGKLFRNLLGSSVPEQVLREGDRVGVWRIVRLLGRGGMSEVFLAQRESDDFEQTVAIKVIAAQVDAAELLRMERRYLGKLRHPGLATLIDGGELASGAVWFAMEYVEGQAIDVYAGERRIDWSARVALVQQVCEAVGYAHQHLLIHRDIKPSNVLVDERGHARLIDFGIAVGLDVDSTPSGWMTPGFAAPEQLQGGVLTTATDVFQLGQLLRVLTEPKHLPALPPAAVATNLQAIIARASHVDPASRFGSAAELAAHLAALRTLRPLPGGGITQGVKLWWLRHRWVQWVILPVLLMVGLSLTEAIRSAWRESEERAAALREEQVASAIGTFFIDLFNEPVQSNADTSGVTALLDRGQLRLRDRPFSQPEVQAALLLQLAVANVQMERRDMAVELLKEAIRVQRQAKLQAPLARSLAVLAKLEVLAGAVESGSMLAAEAHRLLEADLRPTRDRFLALTHLGEYYGVSSGYAQGERVLREALVVGAQRYGDESPELYRTERLLLEFLRNQWRADQALPLAESLNARCARIFGAEDAQCVVDFIQLQRTKAQAGRLAQARQDLESLWAKRTQWDGTLRHYRVHSVLFGLSDVQAIEGDLFASLASVQASMCALERAEGRGGMHWTIDSGSVAMQLMDLGAVEVARALSEQARGLMQGTASSSLESAFWTMRQARLALAAGAGVDAALRDSMADAKRRLRVVYGSGAYFSSRAALVLARIETSLGNTSAALKLAEEAEAAQPSGLYYYHPYHLSEIDELRAALATDSKQRIALLQRAEDRMRQLFGERHIAFARLNLLRLQAQFESGQPVDANKAIAAYNVATTQQVIESPLLRQAQRWLTQLNGVQAPLAVGQAMPALEPECPSDAG